MRNGFRLTKPATQEKIGQLMAGDPQYKTFADACNYPDQPRKRAEEHFINLPRDAAGLTSDQCPLAAKCVLSAIHEDFGRLMDAKNDADMLDALKFLGHWVGDIHQPLHVSFLDDLGGNKITVSGCERSRSLHAVWDSCLVTFAIGPDLDDAVDHLLKQVTTADITN